jgi:hypothetical protein
MRKEIVLKNDVEFLPAKIMTAGKFELMYETGRARYIKYDGEEILRMIYPALRDEHWATIPGKLINEKISSSKQGFEITYGMEYDNSNIRYKASFKILWKEDKLEYIMNGEALSDFKSKRVGLCVHHPINSCAGREVIINKKQISTYPTLIAPVWPFTDITEMHWNTGNNDVQLNFEGDFFETEDQRNWTDDSYKTYSGPQYKTPMLDIRKGDTMQHKITLTAKAHKTISSPTKKSSVLKFPFSKIGYGGSLDNLTKEEKELLKHIPFHETTHLSNDWFADLNAKEIENDSSIILAFKVSPQVHQDDNRSILENLGSQRTTIQTLKKRAGDRPVYVSPIIFSNKEDKRLHTQFAAWWTINTICNFAEAEQITLFELKGPKGILYSPIYDMLKTIKAFDPKYIYKSDEAIVLENAKGDELLYKFNY